MSSTSRRFGTDVSNIPADVLKQPSKKMPTKPQAAAKPKRVPAPQEVKSSKVDHMEALIQSTFKIAIDDEITFSSPVKLDFVYSDDYRYERDYLLMFKDICTEPIEGLIPEVLPGYVHTESQMEASANLSKPQQGSSSVHKNKIHKVNSASAARPETSPEPISQAPSESSFDLSSLAAINSKEWRIKQARKQKPREEDERRLAARQKQIDIGMNTLGYQKFLESFPPGSRSKAQPKIPDIHQVCSKRSWDGQVRKWRRLLHKFDPTAPEAAGEEYDSDLAQNAAERHATDPTLDNDNE